MKPVVTLLLRVLIVLIGIAALALLLWEPHLEGRNAHATLYAIYFNDPFLAFAYTASIAFFVGLYQAYKALGNAALDGQCTTATLRSIRIIKYCALALIAFAAIGEGFIMLTESDDRAGGVFIGILIMIASIVVATAMAYVERSLRGAVGVSAAKGGVRH